MNDRVKPPRLSRAQIIRQAEGLIRSYFDLAGYDFALLGINFDVIFEEFIYPEFGIELIEDEDLGQDEQGEQILGFFQPKLNRVFIDRSLRDDPRRVFTCWHEVGGHAILQGDWIRAQLRNAGTFGPLVTTESMLSPNVENVLERQANLFAAHAAAPSWLVSHAVRSMFGLSHPYCFIGPGRYCFAFRSGTHTHEIADFAGLCTRLALYIQRWFGGLSVEALSYRIAESRWVVDTTRAAGPSSGLTLRRRASTLRRSRVGESHRMHAFAVAIR